MECRIGWAHQDHVSTMDPHRWNKAKGSHDYICLTWQPPNSISTILDQFPHPSRWLERGNMVRSLINASAPSLFTRSMWEHTRERVRNTFVPLGSSGRYMFFSDETVDDHICSSTNPFVFRSLRRIVRSRRCSPTQSRNVWGPPVQSNVV